MNTELPHKHGNKKLENFIFKTIPKKEDISLAADVFKLLDDPNRLLIFWTLCHIEECVINLSAMLNISSPALSHHLKTLKAGKIIISRREGKEVYYKTADTEEAKAIHKAVEQIMMITCPKNQNEACRHSNENMSEPLGEQEKSIHEIHDYLSSHLNERITIEELSHRFLMNPTTLKIKFKEVYGNSVAAHIKEHRMEKAAELLTKTDFSIAEIAAMTGYASASKFSIAFQNTFGLLPLEYRKSNKSN